MDESVWLTLGKIYHVMGVRTESGKGVDYLIVANNVDPGFAAMSYHPSESFEVVSDIIPPNWEKVVSGGSERTLPSPWLAPGFFQQFYDGDASAYSIYERERDVVINSDP
ncbi:hypothetical protein [Frateuria defendens]|uniref:hypothetical protein n=1 Tax=Frateuria defendens TaxID=2219559 RepID=UPI001293D16A|nr:hypothetical protein [Frateuria defendens]